MVERTSSTKRPPSRAKNSIKKAVAKSKSMSTSASKLLSATRRAAEHNLTQQIHVPINILMGLIVMHMLSSPSSLSLSHLSFHLHLPQTLHSIIPSWLRLPSLSQFASDLPNASERDHAYLQAYNSAGPFRSDARGFGHPLTALHLFTRAGLGLSYPVPDPKRFPVQALKHETVSAFETMTHTSSSHNQPWSLLYGVDGYLYQRGWKDALFVATFVLIFTAFRAIWMKYVLLPIGEYCIPALKRQQGIKPSAKSLRTREKEVLRFAEQGFSLTYYTCSWSLGLFIASREAYWPLNTVEYWTGPPQNQLDPLTKFYYLAECAFYIQQLFVLNVEARRSDHLQMLSHHVITIVLIAGSYLCSYHRVGNAILCLMDPSDICLSLAKMLKYSGLQTLCDIAFGIFMVSWLITRHILYMTVLWSCIFEAAQPDNGLHKINWSTGDVFSEPAYCGLVVLLFALQVILLIWFVMIVRVAYRVVTKVGATDSRSDDESSQEGENEDLYDNDKDTTPDTLSSLITLDQNSKSSSSINRRKNVAGGNKSRS